MPRIKAYSITGLLTLTCIVLLVALITSCSAKGPNLTGAWILKVEDGLLTMELVHMGDTVTGIVNNSAGYAFNITYGRFENGRLTFTCMVEGEAFGYCTFNITDNSRMDGQLTSLEKKHTGEQLLVSAHRAETGNLFVVLKGGWSGSVVDSHSKLSETTYLDLYGMEILDSSLSCPNPNQMEFSVAGFVGREPRIDVQPIYMGNVSNRVFTFQYNSDEDIVLAVLSLDSEGRLVGKYSTPRTGVEREVVLSKVGP